MAVLAGAIRQSFVFRDRRAFTARTQLYLSYSSVAADNPAMGQIYAQDLYALQNGDGKLLHDGATIAVAGIGPFENQAQPWAGAFNGAGDYENVEDKAVLFFQDIFGGLHRVSVACPLASIFLADQMTVDVSQTVVKQFLADVLAVTVGGTTPNAGILRPAVNRAGNTLIGYVNGIRMRRKTQRHINIFTRNATLSGPDE